MPRMNSPAEELNTVQQTPRMTSTRLDLRAEYDNYYEEVDFSAAWLQKSAKWRS